MCGREGWRVGEGVRGREGEWGGGWREGEGRRSQQEGEGRELRGEGDGEGAGQKDWEEGEKGEGR